jgi:mRNA interferase MazF
LREKDLVDIAVREGALVVRPRFRRVYRLEDLLKRITSRNVHRPALVLSPASYNRLSGLMLCCPMTSQKKGYPFEVAMVDAPDRRSVVLADQVKSLDWKVRKAVKKRTAPGDVVAETLSKLHALL